MVCTILYTTYKKHRKPIEITKPRSLNLEKENPVPEPKGPRHLGPHHSLVLRLHLLGVAHVHGRSYCYPWPLHLEARARVEEYAREQHCLNLGSASKHKHNDKKQYRPEKNIFNQVQSVSYIAINQPIPPKASKSKQLQCSKDSKGFKRYQQASKSFKIFKQKVLNCLIQMCRN